MTMTLKDFVAEHPVDRERVEAHKERMLAEVRAYRLRELRNRPASPRRSSPSASASASARSPRSSTATSTARRSAPSAITSRPSAADSRSST